MSPISPLNPYTVTGGAASTTLTVMGKHTLEANPNIALNASISGSVRSDHHASRPYGSFPVRVAGVPFLGSHD